MIMNTEHCDFQAVLVEEQNLIWPAGYIKVFMCSCFTLVFIFVFA
jgi:hypothetical protein